MNSRYQFEYPNNESSIIKVIGVGGGGGNAVNHMFRQGIRGVDFYVCNTDVQALEISPVPNKIQLGLTISKGLGAGANPERGRNAAIESKDDIRQLLSQNTRMVFITAGMGGGTGTGAAPVIAEIAKELGILTVGIVTIPFSFEGSPKMKRAEEGLNELRKNCDTLLVILNNKLKDVYGNMTMREAFGQADNVLARAAKSIAEIITVSGQINVDFEDVRTVMRDSGVAVMGSATAEGESRAKRAVEAALNSPLLNNTNIHGSKYVLLSIVIGDDDNFKFEEMEEITTYVQHQAGEEAEVIFGYATDESLGKAIGVTIIATGFSDKPVENPKKVFDLEKNKMIKEKVKVVYDNFDEFFNPSEQQTAAEEPIRKKIALPTTVQKPEKIVHNLEGEYHTTTGVHDEKKKVLETEYEIRKRKMDSLKSVHELSNEELQQKRDVPAYLRKNVKLEEVKHANATQLSRVKINEDNELLGGNKFLHDNVD
jgi:cell division protein FtsZ